jgi:hypothetical protein
MNRNYYVVRCSLRPARTWFISAFPDEVGRQTHLARKVAAALKTMLICLRNARIRNGRYSRSETSG